MAVENHSGAGIGKQPVRPAQALEWFTIPPGKVEQAGTEENVRG